MWEDKINILRKKLINKGFKPGPIDNSLYHIYKMKLKMLEEMERENETFYKENDTSDKKNEKEVPQKVTVVINNNGIGSSTILFNLLILLFIYIIYLKYYVNSTDLLVV